jgi:hypothetical protein
MTHQTLETALTALHIMRNEEAELVIRCEERKFSTDNIEKRIEAITAAIAEIEATLKEIPK